MEINQYILEMRTVLKTAVQAPREGIKKFKKCNLKKNLIYSKMKTLNLQIQVPSVNAAVGRGFEFHNKQSYFSAFLL